MTRLPGDLAVLISRDVANSLFTTLIALALSNPPLCDLGTVCSSRIGLGPVSLTVSLSMTLEPSQQLSIDWESPDPESGLWIASVTGIETGSAEATQVTERYLVLGETSAIQFAFLGGKIETSHDEDVLVVRLTQREYMAARAATGDIE